MPATSRASPIASRRCDAAYAALAAARPLQGRRRGFAESARQANAARGKRVPTPRRSPSSSARAEALSELQAELAAAREEAAAARRSQGLARQGGECRYRVRAGAQPAEPPRRAQGRGGCRARRSEAAQKKADELEAAKAVLERDIIRLKSELGEMQKKLEAATTAAAAQAAPQGAGRLSALRPIRAPLPRPRRCGTRRVCSPRSGRSPSWT